EPQARSSTPETIWEDCGSIARPQTVPIGKGGRVLVTRRCRYPLPAITVRIIGPAQTQFRVAEWQTGAIWSQRPVEHSSQYRPAHNKSVTAPGVVGSHCAGARTRWLQGSAEIGEREGGDTITESLRHHLVIEGTHRLAQLRK